MTTKKLHAFFSQSSKEEYGSIYYAREDGTEVEVTSVSDSREGGHLGKMKNIEEKL